VEWILHVKSVPESAKPALIDETLKVAFSAFVLATDDFKNVDGLSPMVYGCHPRASTGSTGAWGGFEP